MSLAKKCDICGNFYEHYGKTNGISINRFDERGALIFTEKHIECCPTCFAKLREYLQERARENGRVS